LGAAPELAKGDKSKSAPKSRIKSMQENDEEFEPEMPDAGAAAYLLDHFWSVGPTQGDSVITSGELRDYQANMGISLTPWECRTLRRLSIDYLNESQRATKRDCPAPFADSSDAIRLRQAELSRNLDAFLN
jgi:hypothetical protein